MQDPGRRWTASRWSWAAVRLLFITGGLGLCLFAVAKSEAARASDDTAPIHEQRYTVDAIQDAVLRFMQEEVGSGHHQIEVDVLQPRDAIAVPRGPTTVKLVPLGMPDRLGRRGFHLQLLVNGKKARTIRVLADVTMRASVVTAARMIRPNETIGEQDVAMDTITLRRPTHSFISDMDSVIGKRAVRALPAHAPIHLGALASPYLIKKGQRVTIEAKRGGLLIHAIGIAQSAGAQGQTLPVTNLDTKREIHARVLGPGLVEVDF